jgi:hypothetical protein
MSWIGEWTAREKSMICRTGGVQKRQGVSWISCTFCLRPDDDGVVMMMVVVSMVGESRHRGAQHQDASQ